MTMISDLPRDLVNEIVLKVPMKSMKKVQLTCKNWNTLTKSEILRKMHIRNRAATKREGEAQMTVMMDKNLYLVSFFVSDPSIEFLGKLTCLGEQVKVSTVFNCDGLLLCVLEEDHSKVVVWNPYWGQTRWIECRFYHGPDKYDCFNYALGYEDKKSCRSHKVLRFIDENPWYQLEVGFFWYEIYDFDSGLWTTLDVIPYWTIRSPSHGFSLRGNTYWLASERQSSEDRLGDHIICFDFTSERFGPLLHLPFYSGSDVILSCVREEKLVVLHQDMNVTPTELIIWITTKIEAGNISWSKFLTLNGEFVEYPILEDFFIDEEKKVVMGTHETPDNHCSFSIIGEGGYFKLLDRGEGVNNAFPYVPSLVQIKQSAGGKEKQQSVLEMRRFDENMSRLAAIEERVAAAEEQARLRRAARLPIKCGTSRGWMRFKRKRDD